MKNSLIVIAFISLAITAKAQEFQARVNVVALKVSNNIDKRIFKTLTQQLTNFLNNRKWTTDVWSNEEKIQANFVLTIDEEVPGETNVFKATLSIQAARPVFNSTYNSFLANYNDDKITFKYLEFQPIEFNENRVAGSDALTSNLSATFAYYAYMILGLDYASFSSKGGDPYFTKALNIVNNAPDGRNIEGWKAFDGIRNRYWLVENLTNAKYYQLHDALYYYYRSGLDAMFDDEMLARQQIFNALNSFYAVNDAYPNLMFLQFFFQGRFGELSKMFKKAMADERVRAIELLQKLDIANADNYAKELK
jgi:hypothetical protein